MSQVCRYIRPKKQTFIFLLSFISLLPIPGLAQIAGDYVHRGKLQSDRKDYAGAILNFTKAIELKPDLVEAYVFRGISKVKLGDHKGAILDYDKAIELKPDYA